MEFVEGHCPCDLVGCRELKFRLATARTNLAAIRQSAQENTNQAGQKFVQRNWTCSRPSLSVPAGHSASLSTRIWYSSNHSHKSQGDSHAEARAIAGPGSGQAHHHAAARLKKALDDYAALYARTYGAEEPVAELVPFMLDSFLKADAGFRKGRKELEAEPMALPLVTKKAKRGRQIEGSNEEAGS